MIEIRGLRFHYQPSGFRLAVPQLKIAAGERVAVIGPSGVGKTTLAYLIAGILTPDEGTIRVGDVELSACSDRARRDFRITRVGFVFQEFELLEYLTVRDNIRLPHLINTTLPLDAEVTRVADSLARSLGLGDKLTRYPRTLSQGERQRVAICRALIASPALLIADEPTGNLDPKTAESIVDLLLNESRRREAVLLMVTHNHALLESFDRVIDLQTLLEESTS